MTSQEDDKVKTNIYAEQPGEPIKPETVAVTSTQEEDKKMEEIAEKKLAEQKEEDKINDANNNDTSGVAS